MTVGVGLAGEDELPARRDGSFGDGHHRVARRVRTLVREQELR
ncbi:MAG TPA: hypothetical protein VFR38_09905 [Gaiellaceae bacterium]|nr:hypothetical protein [Gaiellaceae bacterium]